MNHLILIGTVALALWLIRRDTLRREGISPAIWIPTLWVGILASRPISAWLGVGAGGDTLEGSPIDRLFFFGMIFASLVVLARRGLGWSSFLARNWPIVLFYAFLLVSVLWANSSLASFKRWFKETGNILVALVILTESRPLNALRAVFVRCAYLLIPLSIVYIRYFPSLGRSYSIHSGELQVTGVTTQKNSLGAMVLVCGLMFVWDWLERSRPGSPFVARFERWSAMVLMAMAAWLMYLSDSKTSMLCLAIGIAILCAVRMPLLHRRISALGIYFLAGLVGFFLLDWMFGISAAVVTSLGRDMTFTGRTDVWRELLNVGTDPFFGTGFMSFWDDMRYRSILPDWVAFSAHNGYLEVYLAGGFIGVGFLVLMLLGTGLKLNRALAGTDEYAVVRFAVFVAMLVANFAESNFACMTPLGFLFLVTAIGQAESANVAAFDTPRWNDLANDDPLEVEAEPRVAYPMPLR